MVKRKAKEMPGSPKLQKYNIFPNPYLNIHSMVLIALSFGALGLVLTRSLLAAPDTGLLTGQITGSADISIVNAKVVVVDSAGSTVKDVQADASGRYNVDDLNAGRYNLSVSADQYMTKRADINIFAGETTVQDFKLDKR